MNPPSTHVKIAKDYVTLSSASTLTSTDISSLINLCLDKGKGRPRQGTIMQCGARLPNWKDVRIQETKSHVHKLDLNEYLNNTGFLRSFKVQVDGGGSVEKPSIWSICFASCGTPKNPPLYSSEEMDFIGIFLDNTEPNDWGGSINEYEFIASCQVRFEGAGNSICREIGSSPISSFEKGCWCWKKVPAIPYRQFFDQNSNVGSAPKQVELTITFTLVIQSKYTLEKVPSSVVELMADSQRSEREIGQNIYNFIQSGCPEPDVTVESAFGRVYHLHQQVLAGRSPVFQAMFGTSMVERTTGHVKLEDITSEGLELLLRHLYTGQAEKDWLECPEVATELVNSAEKYWLTSLTQFCDKNLIQAANRKNCLRLLELASLHDLNHACDQLTRYVHDKMQTSESNPESSSSITNLMRPPTPPRTSSPNPSSSSSMASSLMQSRPHTPPPQPQTPPRPPMPRSATTSSTIPSSLMRSRPQTPPQPQTPSRPPMPRSATTSSMNPSPQTSAMQPSSPKVSNAKPGSSLVSRFMKPGSTNLKFLKPNLQKRNAPKPPE